MTITIQVASLVLGIFLGSFVTVWVFALMFGEMTQTLIDLVEAEDQIAEGLENYFEKVNK